MSGKTLLLIGILVIIFLSHKSMAQIHVTIENYSLKSVYLQSFTLSGYQVTDSSALKGNKATFRLSPGVSSGIYMIGDSQQGFKFILNEPELEFRAIYPKLEESLVVVKSQENKIFQEYETRRDKTYMQLDLINQVLVHYDRSSAYYRVSLQEFSDVQAQFEYWTDSVIKTCPDTYVSHYIKADKKPVITPGLTLSAQKEFFRQHWFDGVDWLDNTMMTSDVLTSKITSYLGLYSNPNIGKAELSQGFMLAVDQILPLARQNPAVYDFTLKYLIRGFERYGFDDVILHIATKYSATSQCENEQKSETIARLEKYKLLAVGKAAPDIRMKSLGDEDLILSSLKSKKLLVFWASWCPHCQELIPQLVIWSQMPVNKGVTIIPVSLDESRDALQKAINDLRMPWQVYCDFKKWSCQAAVDYNIYATPTMLLLDEDDLILAKPMTIAELNQSLK